MRFAKALLIQTSTSETAGLDGTSPVQDNSDVVMEESAQEDSFTSAIDHTEPRWKSVLENESEIETDSDVEDKRQPLNDIVHDSSAQTRGPHHTPTPYQKDLHSKAYYKQKKNVHFNTNWG
jgi:CMP-N-acetylneuraminic acid synthetase